MPERTKIPKTGCHEVSLVVPLWVSLSRFHGVDVSPREMCAGGWAGYLVMSPVPCVCMDEIPPS